MKTDVVASSGYVKPYPQDALDGKLGLTSVDVASALGTPAANVVRELGRRGYADKLRMAGCELMPVAIKSKGRGRPGTIWVLDTMAAQIFVAQTRTMTGIGFACYLINHERASQKAMAKLARRVEELEQAAEPRKNRHAVVVGYQQMHTLFGDIEQMVIEKTLLLSEMTADEKRAYRIQHLSRIGQGVAKTIEKESTLADIKERQKLLRPVKT